MCRSSTSLARVLVLRSASCVRVQRVLVPVVAEGNLKLHRTCKTAALSCLRSEAPHRLLEQQRLHDREGEHCSRTNLVNVTVCCERQRQTASDSSSPWCITLPVYVSANWPSPVSKESSTCLRCVCNSLSRPPSPPEASSDSIC
jgi:hypothetical protein